MAKYRKRPVVIEAMQFTEDHADAIQEFIGRDRENGTARNGPSYVEIRTLEGTMHAVPGDWIIKGVAGEFYPCKPDIFEATYEPADGQGAGTEPGSCGLCGNPLPEGEEMFKYHGYSGPCPETVQPMREPAGG